MENRNTHFIAALDIGSSSVKALICQASQYENKLDVLGIGEAPSSGVNFGDIDNIERTATAIEEALKIASSKAGVTIEEVYVSIGNLHIQTMYRSGAIAVNKANGEIDDNDVMRLILDLFQSVTPSHPGYQLIHILPLVFRVDNKPWCSDPTGMSGIRLEGNFLLIMAQEDAIKNICRCVSKAGYRIAGLLYEGLSLLRGVVSEEEKTAGVCTIDIGHGKTTFALAHNNLIQQIKSLPFGGSTITKDIQEGCSLLYKYAEELKIRSGTAYWRNETIDEILEFTIKESNTTYSVSRHVLHQIIRARLEEIFELILLEIDRQGLFNQLHGGIILTGGTANMPGIASLAEEVIGMKVRIGRFIPRFEKGLITELDDPRYAVVAGLAIYLFNPIKWVPPYDPSKAFADVMKSKRKTQGPQIFKGLKSFFEKLVDTDLID